VKQLGENRAVSSLGGNPWRKRNNNRRQQHENAGVGGVKPGGGSGEKKHPISAKAKIRHVSAALYEMAVRQYLALKSGGYRRRKLAKLGNESVIGAQSGRRLASKTASSAASAQHRRRRSWRKARRGKKHGTAMAWRMAHLAISAGGENIGGGISSEARNGEMKRRAESNRRRRSVSVNGWHGVWRRRN
jgi:hypothetical protein